MGEGTGQRIAVGTTLSQATRRRRIAWLLVIPLHREIGGASATAIARRVADERRCLKLVAPSTRWIVMAAVLGRGPARLPAGSLRIGTPQYYIPSLV